MPPSISGTPDPVAAYAEAVLDGGIVAGPLVRKACERQLADLREGPGRGLVWRLDMALRTIEFFPDVLRLPDVERDPVSGDEVIRFEDAEPFNLSAWEQFIVGCLFGWYWTDGARRFRVGYVEVGKGNGKTPIAAGIGLYMQNADRQAKAECYAAAAIKDQAKIQYRDAVNMVRASEDLLQIVELHGEKEVYNLVNRKTGSFYKPISAEKRGLDGKRVHYAGIDEVHEHTNALVCDKMRAGTKGRRNALIFEITNSGFDRTSVCYQHHEYSERVLSGQVPLADSDSWFAYVCGLDPERTEVFHFPAAMRYMANSCTCKHVPSTLIDRLSREAWDCANSATRNGIGSVALKDAHSIQTDRPKPQDSAQLVTTGSTGSARQQVGSENESIKRNGTTKTSSGSENTSDGGSPTGPDTGSPRPKNSGFESSEFQGNDTTSSLKRSPGDALSAKADQSTFPSITIIGQGSIEDCFARDVIPGSVSSEILQKVYSAHLPTCSALKEAEIDEATLKVHFPADDPLKDETCWPKANPNLGVSIQSRYLRDQVSEARGMPSKESIVRRLNFCQWVDAENPWIDGDLWRACEQDFDLEELKGRPGFGGLDLSGTRDLTAHAMAFPNDDGSVDAFVEFWTPGVTLAERSKEDRVPYSLWVKEGHVRATPGRAVDYAFVAHRLGELKQEFELEATAFDPYRIKYFESDLAEAGIELKLVPHSQGYFKASDKDAKQKAKVDGGEPPPDLWMPRSVELLEGLVMKGLLRVKLNPCLRWNSASAVLKPDPKNNRIFDKLRSKGRIDGIVALAQAVGLALNKGQPAEAQEPQLLFV